MSTPAAPDKPIAATRNDGQDLKPMTEMPVLMPLYIPFTEAQMTNIRLGYVPVAREEKWFAYFADSALHIYRSWTGFYMFRIHFEPRADGWRATHAEINMDPEYFDGSLEEARASLLAELNYYATPEAHEPQEDGLVTALKLAMQPNYLGAPATVQEALHPFFSSVVNHKLGSYIQDLAKVSYQDTIDQNLRVTRIFSGDDPAYTTMPAWHTADELGRAVIRYLDLDSDYHDGENLSCIVSEGLAGVALQVGKLVSGAVNDTPFDVDALVERLGTLEAFVVAVLLGTNTVYMPGRTLKDYCWECDRDEVETDEDECEEIDVDEDDLQGGEPEPVPGPPLHPRPDEHGDPVKLKLKHPSTPTKLSAWHDPSQTATVIPDGPMPTKINGVPFLSWAKAPTTDFEWKSVSGQMLDLVEPAFHVGAGKHAAAGVVVEEADGRLWIVHPSNGFGGYTATFPKGRADALGSHLQAVAIREAHEEAGLQVRITGFLADSQRTVTTTRYYLARRIGGNPADMGWESQAVSLVPRAALASFLTNTKDAPLLKALLKQAD